MYGSAISLLVVRIKSGTAITITKPVMTRFLMNLDEVVNWLNLHLYMQIVNGLGLFKENMHARRSSVFIRNCKMGIK